MTSISMNNPTHPHDRADLLSPEAEHFSTRHRTAILFITIVMCIAGIYASMHMPSAVFPETNFPRVVILIDNGVMPGDQMMATITRPVEEAMKDIPGVVQVRSATGRGSAEVNVFFDWKTDMVQSELYVLSRVSQLKSQLPPQAETTVWRLTFNAFPVLGVSLTSDTRDQMELWEIARYDLKPRFLRIEGIARVDLVGGRSPEYQVIVDPLRLASTHLSLDDITAAVEAQNLVVPAGYHTENNTLYLALVDDRAMGPEELSQLVVRTDGERIIRLKDVARIERAPEPVFNVVNAQGSRAVLLNIRAQPSGSNVLQIASTLKDDLAALEASLPDDVKLSFYYDQSIFVSESVRSVWEAIFVGLLFALLILYAFLRNWGSVLTAIVVIPVSVLATILVMYLTGMTFNLMTLGGIGAAIGLIIDDAIVVVETLQARIDSGVKDKRVIAHALREIFHPLIGSTLTPVVVFIPLSFLDGLPGVFFRALALTMVVSLLTSLVLALTLTPALASIFLVKKTDRSGGSAHPDGRVFGTAVRAFERSIRFMLLKKWLMGLACVVILASGLGIYGLLKSDFMPEIDEGGFIIDYRTPDGTSLEETDRMMREAEAILLTVPEVEGYSRRTGARLALAIAEPNTGDFLVKLKTDRGRDTESVISELRGRFNTELPGVEWEFPGILGDLIGDLTWSPKPIEVKLFSNDTEWLTQIAPKVQEVISKVLGVVDTFDGLVRTGPTISIRVRQEEAARLGLTSADIASVVSTAMLGKTSTSILEGDRQIDIRVRVEDADVNDLQSLRSLPLRSENGYVVTLGQVADLTQEDGQLELHREDLRQLVAVTGDLEGRDTGSAIAAIQNALSRELDLPEGVVEFGGLFEQQQAAFQNLLMVLFLGITLVFTVLLIEFRSFVEPVAIVTGAVLALFGTIVALWLTGTSLNIVSFLGAIIGVGIVAKNGILMLDLVDHHRSEGLSTTEALVRSGKRRLRPILMTSLATLLAMLPMAMGIGHGADMLRPMAIGIIGALSISVLFSLLVTPVVFHVLVTARDHKGSAPDPTV